MKLHMQIECRDREHLRHEVDERMKQFFGQGWNDAITGRVRMGEISVRANPNLERRSWSSSYWVAEFDVEAP